MENITARSTKFGVLGIDTDVLYQWRDLVPAYEEKVSHPSGAFTLRTSKSKKPTHPSRSRVTPNYLCETSFLENITSQPNE